MTREQKLQSIVEEVLKKNFEDLNIGDIKSAISYGQDGNELLIVKVGFEGPENQFDTRKILDTLSQTLTGLSEIGEDIFPMISYLSSDEMSEIKDVLVRSPEYF